MIRLAISDPEFGACDLTLRGGVFAASYWLSEQAYLNQEMPDGLGNHPEAWTAIDRAVDMAHGGPTPNFYEATDRV